MKMLTILITLLLMVGCARSGPTNGERIEEDRRDGSLRRINHRSSYKVIEIDANTKCVVILDRHTVPTGISCNWGNTGGQVDGKAN